MKMALDVEGEGQKGTRQSLCFVYSIAMESPQSHPHESKEDLDIMKDQFQEHVFVFWTIMFAVFLSRIFLSHRFK